MSFQQELHRDVIRVGRVIKGITEIRQSDCVGDNSLNSN